MVTETSGWIELEQTASTSSWLIEKIRSGVLTGATGVRAQRQTAGRGRLGRTWLSKENASCCFSVAVPLQGMPTPTASLRVGLETVHFLQSMGASGLMLKWPNDLLINHRKAGGILCESLVQESRHWLVVGVGLNLRRPDSFAKPDSSLEPAGLDEVWSRADELLSPKGLCKDLAEQIQKSLLASEKQSFQEHVAAYNRLDAFRGLSLRVLEGEKLLFQGMGRGVDTSGHYLVETPEGLRNIASGELSLRVSP